VARFFNPLVDFNALPSSNETTGGFIPSILIAFAFINKNAAANDVILSHYFYDETVSRWHFYFDYTVESGIVDLSDYGFGLAHAVEVYVMGNEVVNYRRLMLRFWEE